MEKDATNNNHLGKGRGERRGDSRGDLGVVFDLFDNKEVIDL